MGGITQATVDALSDQKRDPYRTIMFPEWLFGRCGDAQPWWYNELKWWWF